MADPFEVRQVWSFGRIGSYTKGAAGLLAIFAFPFVFILIAPDGLGDEFATVFSVIATGVVFATILWAITAIQKGDFGFDRPVRLTIFSGGFTIVPDDWGKARINVSWDQLKSIALFTDKTKRRRLHFKTTDGNYDLRTHFLDQSADEIIRRIELQLEQSRRHLLAVDGADAPTWEVHKGLPYDRATRPAFGPINPVR